MRSDLREREVLKNSNVWKDIEIRIKLCFAEYELNSWGW